MAKNRVGRPKTTHVLLIGNNAGLQAGMLRKTYSADLNKPVCTISAEGLGNDGNKQSVLGHLAGIYHEGVVEGYNRFLFIGFGEKPAQMDLAIRHGILSPDGCIIIHLGESLGEHSEDINHILRSAGLEDNIAFIDTNGKDMSAISDSVIRIAGKMWPIPRRESQKKVSPAKRWARVATALRA